MKKDRNEYPIVVVDPYGKIYRRYDTFDEASAGMQAPCRSLAFVLNREFKRSARKTLLEWQKHGWHEQHNFSVHGFQYFFEDDFKGEYPTTLDFTNIHKWLENHLDNIHTDNEIESVINDNYEKINAKHEQIRAQKYQS